MAVFRDTSGGRLLLPTRCRATFVGHPTGDGEVPVRSVGWPSIHCVSYITIDQVRCICVSGAPPPPTLAPPPSVSVHLPVWPSPRRLWPPPVCVCGFRGVGTKGVRLGKCSSPRLVSAVRGVRRQTWSAVRQGGDGAALLRARRRKEHTYPELSGANGRARLVVLACEVAGPLKASPS